MQPAGSEIGNCKARARINDADLESIHDKVTAKVQQRVLEDQRWKGRDVKVLDGTGITLADTPENLVRRFHNLRFKDWAVAFQ